MQRGFFITLFAFCVTIKAYFFTSCSRLEYNCNFKRFFSITKNTKKRILLETNFCSSSSEHGAVFNGA